MTDVGVRADRQIDHILTYLKRGNSINPMVALRLFGSFRLAARIQDLKDQGYLIQRELTKTREGKRVAIYYLGKKKAPGVVSQGFR